MDVNCNFQEREQIVTLDYITEMKFLTLASALFAAAFAAETDAD